MNFTRAHLTRTTLGLVLMAGAGYALLVPAEAASQSQAQKQRTIQGTVQNAAGAPVAGAIVYLKNANTLTVKTYVTPADGAFRFGQVAMDSDMQVYAEIGGKKSQTKNISNFDTKKVWDIALKIDR